MAYLVSIPVYNSCLFLRKWANHIEINVGASVVHQTWLYLAIQNALPQIDIDQIFNNVIKETVNPKSV